MGATPDHYDGDGQVSLDALRHAVFRHLNDHVAGSAAASVDGRRHIVCECSDLGCIDWIELTDDEYERLRESPGSFAVLPGHEPADAQTVERKGRFSIVSLEPVTDGGTAPARR